jgi:hypothetical protein
MVMVNAGPPAVALDGLTEEIEVDAELIVNDSAFEIAPLEFSTVTLAIPVLMIRFEGTAAVN